MSKAPQKQDNQPEVAKDPAGNPENTTEQDKPLDETAQMHHDALKQIQKEQEWNKANREKLADEQKKSLEKAQAARKGDQPAPNPGAEGQDTASGAPSAAGDAVGVGGPATGAGATAAGTAGATAGR